MYVGKDFSDAEPTESEPYTLDFIRDLDNGEALVSATFLLDVESGEDSNPMSHLVPSAAVANTKAFQEIRGLKTGVRYRVTAIAITDQSRTIALHSYVTCCGAPSP